MLKKSIPFILFVLPFVISACATKPMYQEGDVHLQTACGQDTDACEQSLRQVCQDEHNGITVDLEIKQEDVPVLHLTCRPPRGTGADSTSDDNQEEEVKKPLPLD